MENKTIEEVLMSYRNSEHCYSFMLWQKNLPFGCKSCLKQKAVNYMYRYKIIKAFHNLNVEVRLKVMSFFKWFVCLLFIHHLSPSPSLKVKVEKVMRSNPVLLLLEVMIYNQSHLVYLIDLRVLLSFHFCGVIISLLFSHLLITSSSVNSQP